MIYEQGTSESGMGEMIYLEPNETNNFRSGQNMSPLNDSRNLIMRSPITQGVRNDYGNGGIVNMSQQLNFLQNQRSQQRTNDIEGREMLSSSPKTTTGGRIMNNNNAQFYILVDYDNLEKNQNLQDGDILTAISHMLNR